MGARIPTTTITRRIHNMDTRQPTLVIARHEESLDWLLGREEKHIVIQKGVDTPNIGREPISFLYFIVRDYEKLQGDYIFVQGKPFDHQNPLDGQKREKFKCKPNGSPHHAGLEIHAVCKELDLPILEEYEFDPGGQFKVSAEQIKERPWEWYIKALHITTKGENPWVLERLWNYIWTTN